MKRKVKSKLSDKQIESAFLANGGLPKPKPKHPGGAPSKYPTINLDQALKLSIAGWTDLQMCQFFNVSMASWTNYKSDNPQFLATLKLGKEEADDRVEQSLFQRATGSAIPEEKVFYDMNTGIVTHQTVKHFPPDTAAAIIWLKNRRPKDWREKEPEDDTPKTINITFSPAQKK